MNAIEGNVLQAGSFKIPISKYQRDLVLQNLRISSTYFNVSALFSIAESDKLKY